jgi:hypothetical protein
MLTFFWKASFVNLDQDCKERGWILGRDIMRRILNLSLVADYDTLHLNQHTHMISNALLKNSLFVARILILLVGEKHLFRHGYFLLKSSNRNQTHI